MDEIVVLGAGVIGLTTAVSLAESGRRVRVWSPETPGRTTSAAASGLWAPGKTERALAWSRVTRDEFTRLAEDDRSGIHFEHGLVVSPEDDLGWTREWADVQPCAPADLPPGFATGIRCRAPMIDLPRFLAHLTERLEAAGSGIEDRAADRLDVAPVVVNCTGAGAGRLSGDRGVTPVRGQHVVVRNPGIEHFYVEWRDSPEWAGFFPHGERLLLGGVFHAGVRQREPDPEVAAGILRRCAAVEPRLADPEVIGHVAGIRPARAEVRLEAEQIGGSRVVHNYGHGGQGVSLSWGCAREVSELLADY